MSIDKTDGFTVYFPRECSEHVRVLTSKSSDLNVSFPSLDDPEDWVERPLPEQYIHTIKGNAVHTDVSDIYGYLVCFI